MAAKSNSYAYGLLRLIFNATALDRLAEDNTVDGVTQFYISLHVADPGAGGSQNSSETNYDGYARQAVNRSAAALPVTNGSPPVVNLASQLNFPDPGSSTTTQVITYFGIGLDSTGAGELLYRGEIFPHVTVSYGLTGPALTPATYVDET